MGPPDTPSCGGKSPFSWEVVFYNKFQCFHFSWSKMREENTRSLRLESRLSKPQFYIHRRSSLSPFRTVLFPRRRFPSEVFFGVYGFSMALSHRYPYPALSYSSTHPATLSVKPTALASRGCPRFFFPFLRLAFGRPTPCFQVSYDLLLGALRLAFGCSTPYFWVPYALLLGAPARFLSSHTLPPQ